MAGELEKLLIRLEADTTQLRRALAQADSQIGNFSKNVDRQTARMEKQWSAAGAMMTRAFSAYALVQTARSTVDLADKYTLLQNRLAVVTKSSEELDFVQSALFKNAQDARVAVQGSVELYSRFAFALKDVGVSTNDLLKFTDVLNKSMTISGATTAEAHGALVQLSQGLAAGTLRGQELNSVMEQLPIVADMVANKMGVTIGQLRKLGEQGKITGDIVLSAILGSADDINARFSKVNGTVAQGFTKLGNSMLEFVGLLNTGTDASGALAGAIDQVTEAIERGNRQVKNSKELMAFLQRPGVGGYEQGSSFMDAIKGVPQWINDRLSNKPLAVSNPTAYAQSLMKGGLYSDGSNAAFDPNAKGVNRTPASPDPWAASIIPPSAEEQLRELTAQWQELRDVQTMALEDLIGDKTETGAAKMAALTAAVKDGSIAWADFSDMQKEVAFQTERANDDMLSSTSSFLDTMFANNKTAATASALINTYQGITKALSAYPPPYSTAMAAMQAAMGFAQVRAIQSTSKSSRGGGSAPVASSAGGAASAAPAAAAPQQDRALTVRMSSMGELIGRRGLRELMEQIVDAQRDGYRVVLG